MRTRLCMNPVCLSWRIPASMMGKPVRPAFQASRAARASGPVSTSMPSKVGFQLCQALRGQCRSTSA